MVVHLLRLILVQANRVALSRINKALFSPNRESGCGGDNQGQVLLHASGVNTVHSVSSSGIEIRLEL